MLKTLTKENNQNAVFVGFLSISKLIDETHFLIFLYILEEKLEKNILNLKAVSLIITDFIDRHKRKASLAIYDFMKNIDVFKPCRLALLDGIYYAKYFDEILVEIAKKSLDTDNSEILTKALKILSKAERIDEFIKLEEILTFLKHPSWIVKLSALKLLEKNLSPEIADYLIPLLEDKNALVRKYTAKIIFKLPDEVVIRKFTKFVKN